MEYEDDDDSFHRDNQQTFDEDDDEQPRKKVKSDDASKNEELANEKRGYTAKEQDMIAEWLKKNKPKTDTPDSEEKE